MAIVLEPVRLANSAEWMEGSSQCVGLLCGTLPALSVYKLTPLFDSLLSSLAARHPLLVTFLLV